MKYFFLFFVAAISIFLEMFIFSSFKIFGVTPNVFLMLVIASVFVFPQKHSFFIAFWGSLFFSFFSHFIFGTEPIIYLLLTLGVILSHQYFLTNINSLLLILISFTVTFLYFLLIWLFSFSVGLVYDFIYHLQKILPVLIVVNSFFIMIWFFVIKNIWERILKNENRVKLLR